MPIRLAAPIYKTIELSEIDTEYANEGQATFVIVKQATQYAHEARQALFSQLERKFSAGGDLDEVTLVQNFSLEELKREEVWLTLCDSNIEDEQGGMLFLSKKEKDGSPELNMTRAAFNAAFGVLPPDVATAIHKAVLEVNFTWAPEGEV